MNKKSIQYAAQNIDNNDVKSVLSILRSQYLTQGPIVKKFEEAVSKFCRVKYAVAVNSGTSALHIACIAAGLKKGDEGITSPITFAASANAMIYCGAKPVFADIDGETICINPIEVERKITKRTKIIIPVHFAGQPCDMEKIKSIAEKYNIVVLEDAAHALGAVYKGSAIGACKYSDMTILSFHAVKHITTGEGGMVLTNNRKLYERLILLRSHGISKDADLLINKNEGKWFYEMRELGFNYRLTDIQCALGISQLKKLPFFLKKRKEIVRRYDEFLINSKYARSLFVRRNIKHAYHLYVIRLQSDNLRVSRKIVFEEYRKQGILVNVHYIPVFNHPYYRQIGYRNESCPMAEKYYCEAITWPLHIGLSEKDISRVISVTEKIFKKYSK